MESFISKLRSKKAKERSAMPIDPVEEAVADSGGPTSTRLILHVAGFIAASLLALPFCDDCASQVVASIGAMALVWLVAWPSLRYVTRERGNSIAATALIQLLFIAPIGLLLVSNAVISKWTPLTGFVSQLPFLKNIPAGTARQILADSAPISFAVLAAVLLFGRGACALVGAVSGMTIATVTDFRLAPLAMALAATMAFMRRGRRIGTRSKARRLAMQAALSLCAVAIFFILSSGEIDHDTAIVRIAMAIASALLSALLALAMIPVFEKLSGLYSNITINAFADLDHPLLRELRYKASGTFAHSDRVSMLASAAAEAIGADVILTRVAGYYHDIGKLAKPEYFTENQGGGMNPHDDISPNMSRMIITSHVKEGVAIGRKYHLPPPVLDAIAQHHGNSVIRAFYSKAREQNANQAELPGMPAEIVDSNQYRYDACRPATREVAILMLADITEAAMRSMQGVTKDEVPAKIDRLVKAVADDGQLDDCPLSFRELRDVRKALAVAYVGINHTRVAYPGQEPAQSAPAATPQPDTHSSQPKNH